MQYKVRVKYATVSPLFQISDFLFATRAEAERFVEKVNLRADWAAGAPVVVEPEEVHTADSAYGWVEDEIRACQAVTVW